ncbi:phytoene desaturase family protein [Phytoactinopolyspora halotolerans]|uniref:NAD(P)/FAD-dependent oxidoreductase n=1 Tax=Phytoactinopolyspora halotolerans TaxID=1981512 RepID=A0A6L9SIH9_9ACTN|nr:NAD(P)/FAD-dependent oxidoreductase [Phytoactinopolyspora halotolerans]NEE04232.1 NAD(P)/FAD-dependent oxidoreductase [Phytoactinopolyspora halotolerans]
MARVVVVGAGIAGLTAAARLADFGHRVTIVERGPRAGGQVGLRDVNGALIDSGPTTFTLPAVLRDLFRKTGRPIERELDLVPVTPAARYVFPDGAILDMPGPSRADTSAALDGTFGAGTAAQWERLIEAAEQMWQLLRPRIIDHCPSMRDVTWLAVHPRAKHVLHRGMSLRDLGRRYLADDHLRLMLDAYATSLGGVPTRAPAALAVFAYLDQTFGTWSVRGGMHVLVDVLQRRLVEHGATIRYDSPVTRITAGSGCANGVQLADGECIPADVVVSTVAPGCIEMEGHRRPRWTAPPGEGRSVFTLFLSLGSRPQLPERTILLTEDGPNVTLSCGPVDEPVRPCAATLHADCPAQGEGPGTTDWTADDTAERYAQQLLGLAAARGVDLKRHVVDYQIRTPYDLEQEVGAPGGRVYGTPWHGGSSIRRRLANRSPVHGLYFAGASAHPGPGLPMVAMSATLVADMIGHA